MEKYRRFVSGPEIRANAEKLTDEFARRFGYVFAQWLAERAGTTPDRLTIAVGRDSRASGRRLSAALVAGLTAADSDVLDCGLCAAPALAMTTIEGTPRADGAVMITASAHAPEMNGFKAMQRDGQLTELDLLLLVDRAEQAEIPERLVRRTDALQPYLARLEAMMRRRLEDDALRPLLGIHVVVDAGGGTGGFFASFLEGLGACVDGSFGLSPDGGPDGADPEDPAALERLARAVTENEADMGVLLDPDCAPRRHRRRERSRHPPQPPHRARRRHPAGRIARGDVRHRQRHQLRTGALHRGVGRHALPLQARAPQRHRRGGAPEP